MAEKIKGITIQIDGETKGLQSALKEVNSKTKSLQTELKGVESLLKMDPGNVTLIAQKQELLGNIVAETKKKLDGLKNAQDDVNAAFKKGDVGEEQYRSFQREIIATEQKLKGLEAQQKEVNNAVGKMDVKGIGKGLATGVAAIGTAAVGAGAGLGVLIAQTAEAGGRINDLSQKLGISAEGFQEWEYVMGQSGIDMENLKGGMKSISKAMSDADSTGGAALRNLIGSVEGLSQEEVFNKSITAFQGMADGAEKNALALQIFGKSGQELLPVLNDSAAGTEALRKKAEELGMVMSDKAVKATDDFGDSLDTLTGSATGLRNNLVGELLPGITPVIDQMTSFIGDMSTKIAESGGDWGKVADIMGQGLADMLTSLVQKLPMIIEFGMKLLMSLVDGIIQNLPLILQAAIQCIIAITLGLAQAMPVLIPAIIDAVLLMVDVLLDNLPLLVRAAGELIIGITFGLIKAIPKLISAVPKLIVALVDAFAGMGSSILDVGINLVKGIWNGIKDTTKWIWDKIKGFADGIVDKVKGFFGIHSPSRLFRDDIGLQLGAGMALGIEDSIGKVKSAMSKLSATASPNVMLNSSAMIGGAPDSGILSTLKNIAANSGQQIILDTGVLVGQTAPKMNTALGILARR
jgi:hypothetical protein